MISLQAKRVLYELIKDGVVMIDSSPKNLDARCKALIVLDVGSLNPVYKECFESEYLVSYDDDLSEDNLSGANSKLLMLNIEKAIEDKIFVGFSKSKDIEEWYKESKQMIDNIQKKSLYLSRIEFFGYKDESTKIMKEMEKINNFVVGSGDRKSRRELIELCVKNIELVICSLPAKYHYGLELFSLGTLYNTLTQYDILKDFSRNDMCPCGSKKKFKKCCMCL